MKYYIISEAMVDEFDDAKYYQPVKMQLFTKAKLVDLDEAVADWESYEVKDAGEVGFHRVKFSEYLEAQQK